MTYALPEGTNWFDYYTKQSVASTAQGEWVTASLTDLEQAVFVRAGSILPILLHEDCYALLPCINNDVRLEVYPDSNGAASGGLYLDDGSSLEYSTARDSDSAWHSFTYADGTFSTDFDWGNGYGNVPVVTTVIFYGMSAKPTAVKNSNGDDLTTIYESSTETLYVQLTDNTKSYNVHVVITV